MSMGARLSDGVGSHADAEFLWFDFGWAAYQHLDLRLVAGPFVDLVLRLTWSTQDLVPNFTLCPAVYRRILRVIANDALNIL